MKLDVQIRGGSKSDLLNSLNHMIQEISAEDELSINVSIGVVNNNNELVGKYIISEYYDG
tara:strand:- start:207 stop:386 length:180 start_codon:yes stop_codon:yes gene_type:complete